MPTQRITDRFDKVRAENRAALVTYVMAGDPDLETSYQALCALRDNGADIIELGAPFTDPMADGPAIQRAGQRSLKAGTTLRDVLALAKRFRETDQETPLILMGYANPVHLMGYGAFAEAAADADTANVEVDGPAVDDDGDDEEQEVAPYFSSLRQPRNAGGAFVMLRPSVPSAVRSRMRRQCHPTYHRQHALYACV